MALLAKNGLNLAWMVHVTCAAVIGLFVVSNVVVLQSAGDVADDVRRSVERNLIANEIDRQVEILARDQSQISFWDQTVLSLRQPVNEEFIQEEIADWLWDDFGIQSTIIVSPEGQPVASVFEDTIMPANSGAQHVSETIDLILSAQQTYLARRMPKGAGFVLAGSPFRSDDPLYAADIRRLNGQLGIAVAQAIIPDGEAVLPDGKPQVLLTFKPLTAQAFAEIEIKLGLSDFAIVPARTAAEGFEHIAVMGNGGTGGFEAIWKMTSPAQTIWQRALPVLAAVLICVALALLLVAYRYANALRALQSSEEQNRFLALHDGLTGLPNRLQFDRALEVVISEGAQDRCAILCTDLDRFKTVNDTYGHQAGDTVIKTVASRISKTVGEAGMAARIGGDEFIILLHDRLDRDNVLWLCDQLIEKVCEEIDFDGGSACVGASIGVAWWPDDALTAKTIIRSADEALYRAKENGRGCAYLAGEHRTNTQDLKDQIAV